MLSTALSFLKNLKLSLDQWIAVGLATLIGGLVAALKIQGSRLHRAQVDLLQQKFDQADQANADKVADAAVAYAKAKAAYTGAGGKL